jgi:SAM-dependent methyltransferase
MSDDTAAYYDANTKRFLRFGHGATSASIHRAVWGPGVSNRVEAMNYVDGLVLSDLSDIAQSRVAERSAENGTPHAAPPEPTAEEGTLPVVLDLGCGVGGTIAYLERQLSARYHGVTNSRVQKDIAARAAARRGSLASFHVDDHGDPELYRHRLPAGAVSLVYMIESFVHAREARTILEGVAALLEPGGRFVVCDDVLTSDEAGNSRVVAAFRRGWHIHTLLTVEALTRLAEEVGLRLRRNENLTSYIELERPRDRVIRLIAPAIPRLGLSGPFWDNMYGGNALQIALLSGLLEYRYLVFEAPSSASESSGASSTSSTRPSRR